VIATCNPVIVVGVCYVNALLSLCGDSVHGVGFTIDGSLYHLTYLLSSK
jgi:hypothetical protein